MVPQNVILIKQPLTGMYLVMCNELSRHGCLYARTVAKIRHSKLESVHDNLPGSDGLVLCVDTTQYNLQLHNIW